MAMNIGWLSPPEQRSFPIRKSKRESRSYECAEEGSGLAIKACHGFLICHILYTSAWLTIELNSNNVSDSGNWAPSLTESMIVLSTMAAISWASDGRRFTRRSLSPSLRCLSKNADSQVLVDIFRQGGSLGPAEVDSINFHERVAGELQTTRLMHLMTWTQPWKCSTLEVED